MDNFESNNLQICLGSIPDTDGFFSGVLKTPTIIIDDQLVRIRNHVVVSLPTSKIKSYKIAIGALHPRKENFSTIIPLDLDELDTFVYIDGCLTDIILKPFDHQVSVHYLKIPENTKQTEHYHPDDRLGLILSGKGKLVLENNGTYDILELEENVQFFIRKMQKHYFFTDQEPLELLSVHPNSIIHDDTKTIMLDNTKF